MSKSLAIGLFLAGLAIAAAFGVARDLYSSERTVLKGTVVSADAGGQAYKSSLSRAPNLKVRLEDGQTVDVPVTQTTGFAAGTAINVTEMVMPWGQVWYRLKE